MKSPNFKAVGKVPLFYFSDNSKEGYGQFFLPKIDKHTKSSLMCLGKKEVTCSTAYVHLHSLFRVNSS